MFRVPWITLALIVLIGLSPVGQSVFGSLTSGEQLARSMSQIVLMIYLPIGAFVMLLETGIRILILRRRNLTKAERAAPTET